MDSLESGTAFPQDVEVLAHSALPADQAQSNTRNGPVFYSDMTYFTDPNTKAGVWDSGTNNWIAALGELGPAYNRSPAICCGCSARPLPPACTLRRPNWRNFYANG